MNKLFKTLISIVFFPLLIILTGCDSADAVPEPSVKLKSIRITASPITTLGVDQLTLAAGNKQPFEAVGHYSDGSFQTLTGLSLNDWHTTDLDTGYFNTPGMLVGGDSPGIVEITATKDGITSNTVSVNVTAAVITAIQVTPAMVNVAIDLTQQLTAVATYSDNSSSDISNSAIWTSDDINTATVTPEGLLSGVTIGLVNVTATQDGTISNIVNVDVCADLADACVDIFDTGGGKLFTNSPSAAYLDSIGGSATDDIHNEGGSYGPAGDFYLFNWNSANALCATYNANSVGGRTNWRLATLDELKVELFDAYDSMFIARGWPTRYFSWSVTPENSYYYYYYYVNLYFGYILSNETSFKLYASCVSEL
ncbi:Ig-like domain-containing protein [uncultured Vibrio sp.]|uniref:Ig-like domain-containing protein n=1 Tax=uncultured Vibrio sp. TaxID=114054 RepID=UPI00261680A1|nr:Ig-like domain-containing protein [uncultured Vibrio sp.]